MNYYSLDKSKNYLTALLLVLFIPLVGSSVVGLYFTSFYFSIRESFRMYIAVCTILHIAIILHFIL
jgi:hypothetical protein